MIPASSAATLSTMQTDAGVSLPQLLRRDCTIAATRAGELSFERLDAALGRVLLATWPYGSAVAGACHVSYGRCEILSLVAAYAMTESVDWVESVCEDFRMELLSMSMEWWSKLRLSGQYVIEDHLDTVIAKGTSYPALWNCST